MKISQKIISFFRVFNLRNRNVKIIFSIILAIILIWVSYQFLLINQHKILLIKTSPQKHLISALFLMLAFLFSGIELRYAYKKALNLNLTKYDVISLPIVMNLWGYIIPFQGSFLYTITYLKFKYKIEIKTSFYINVYIFLISLSIAGLIGIIFFISSDTHSIFLLIISLWLFFNPLFIYITKIGLSKIKLKNKILKKIHKNVEYIFSSINLLFKNIHLSITIILIDLSITFINSLWSYWISEISGFNVPFIVFLLIGFFMKITLLLKITPGNLGLTQLSYGGLFILFGHGASEGVFISFFQFMTLIIISFTLGIVFTLINFKHFKKDSIMELFRPGRIVNYKVNNYHE